MPTKKKRARTTSSTDGASASNHKRVKVEMPPPKLIPAPSPAPHPVNDPRQSKNVLTDKKGNAARECTVPTDILDYADSKILSQRFCLLVQARYRAHKQAQELPYYLSRRKELVPLVLDDSQNSPAIAESLRRDQEKELREWVNCGDSSAHLPSVVFRVAGLTSKDAEDAEDEEEEEDGERGDRHWEKIAKKEDMLEDVPVWKSAKEVAAAGAKEAVVEDSSGDDDYAIDHYASDKEEAEDDGN
jgi:hypothetical protein|tara:strand:- start:80 stop:811 length:732 start_codon:yes stop_codon:yes gene_type:complete